MSSIYLTVLTDESGDLMIHLEWPHGPTQKASLRNRIAEPELFEDLLGQCSSGSQGVRALLGKHLGDLLFSGEVGEILRHAMTKEDVDAIFLKTDEARASWPWEISLDADTGMAIGSQLPLIRACGRQAASTPFSPACLLIVPKTSGAARLKSIQAATRMLARRHEMDVFPADPATGPGVRRTLESGAAIVHLATHDESRALLDDGSVPISRLGIDAGTWLAVLADAPVPASVPFALCTAGCRAVVSQQFSLPPHLSSACTRALYKALGSGASLAKAAVQMRLALQQLTSDEDALWAAPVVWSLPGMAGDECALRPFPPNLSRSTGVNASVKLEAPQETWKTLDQSAVMGAPMSAPVFVRDTLRLLASGHQDSADRARRAQALRELGGERSLDAEAPSGLSPAERISYLSDRFVDLLGNPDEPLARPDEFVTKQRRLANDLALSEACVERAATALRAAPVIFLQGGGLGMAQQLARGLAQDVYGYVTSHAPLMRTHELLDGPQRELSGQNSAGGSLFRAVRMNWRRDEVDVFQPEQADPGTRLPLLARRGDGWQVYNGSWLVVPDADRLPDQALRALQQIVTERVFSGYASDGSAYRLVLPRDFRVILLGDWLPAALESTVPIVRVEAGDDLQRTVERWMARVAERLGSPTDQASATARRRAAESVARYARWLRVLDEGPLDRYETALASAIIKGGYPEEAALYGVKLVLDGHRELLSSEANAIVDLVLAGGGEPLRSACIDFVQMHPDACTSLETVLGNRATDDDPAAWLNTIAAEDFKV